MLILYILDEGDDGRFAFAIHKDLNVGIKIVNSKYIIWSYDTQLLTICYEQSFAESYLQVLF